MSRAPITAEFVERLRNMGASDFTVEFAERHVARFSRYDMDRVWRNGVYVGGLLGTFGGLALGYALWH